QGEAWTVVGGGRARERPRGLPELTAGEPRGELPAGLLIRAVLGDADRPHAAHRRLPDRLRHLRVAELAGHARALLVLHRLGARGPLDRHGRLAELDGLVHVGEVVTLHVRRRVLQELQEDLAALLAGRAVQAALAAVDQLGAVRPHGQQHVDRGLDVAAGGGREAPWRRPGARPTWPAA